jgi:uncharacterized protein
LLDGMSPRRRPPGTALITGPTAGIGHEFARQLAGRGLDLVLVARDKERLGEVAAELADEYAVEVEVLPADLTDREQLAMVEARLADPDRPIELLVNNAGFGLKRKFLDNSVEEEQAHLDILVTAPMRLTHAALRQMTARHTGGIVNVSSVAGTQPRGSYSAAKAYLNRFGEWASYEYGRQGVRIMTLLPGFTRTEFHQRMDVGRDAVPPLLWLDAERVVDEALRDFDAGKARSVPSRRYRVIAGVSRHLPPSVLQRFQSLGRR